MTEGSTHSSEQSSPWCLLLPSASDLIFIGLFGTLLCTPVSLKLLADGSIGWHIRTGQIMLDRHAILHTDPFSSIMAGHTWYAWEWLYDLVIGKLDRIAGLNGVVWLGAVLIAAVFSATFRLLVRRSVSFPLALVLMLLAISASSIHLFARPHIVSWLMTVAWFWILDRTERESLTTEVLTTEGPIRQSAWPLWLLPVLMIAWVNIHGGFLFGFALLGIYWISAAFTWARSADDSLENSLVKMRARRRTKRLFLVGVLSAAASFCNPYGWRLYAHIFKYLSNRFLMNHIEEFQSPNFHGIAERFFLALVLLALVALATRARDLRMSEGLLILFAVYAGLYAVRNLPVSSLLLALVCGPVLQEEIERLREKVATAWNRKSERAMAAAKPVENAGEQVFWQRMRQIELSLNGHLWPLVAVVASFFVVMHGGIVASRRIVNAHFDGKRFPVEAVDELKEGKTWGPILAPDYWGGYLIYRLYPKTRVVIDDRHDLYGEEILRDYVKMIRAERGWDDFLTRHDVCCVLAPKGSALANILAESSNWKEVYRDDVAEAFESHAASSP